tara:strand:+ start:8257 stop:8577 length:321 start_codon:yes stop_codon:yes gene_type:complete
MALQYTFTSSTGITSSSAYHKIYKIIYNAKKSTATACAEVFHDVSARNSNKTPIDVVEFEFAMAVGNTDDNPVKQAYAAMKTKESVKDSRGKPIQIDYKSKNVKDV